VGLCTVLAAEWQSKPPAAGYKLYYYCGVWTDDPLQKCNLQRCEMRPVWRGLPRSTPSWCWGIRGASSYCSSASIIGNEVHLFRLNTLGSVTTLPVCSRPQVRARQSCLGASSAHRLVLSVQQMHGRAARAHRRPGPGNPAARASRPGPVSAAGDHFWSLACASPPSSSLRLWAASMAIRTWISSL
jgi:hypothetical protein